MLFLARSLRRYLAVLAIVPVVMLLLFACRKADDEQEVKKRWKLTMIKYDEMQQTEHAEKGFLSGLRDAGLREGVDFEFVRRNAQGEAMTVNAMLDAAAVDGTDMLVTMQTPTLEPTVKRRYKAPVVFMVVANPFVISSVGVSDSAHHPQVSGVYTNTSFEKMLRYIRQCRPSIRRIGTLVAKEELNAYFYRNQLLTAARKLEMEVEVVNVQFRTSVSLDAARLCESGIDAIVQIEDNLTSATFPSIARAAKEHGIPLFSFVNRQAEQGSIMVYAPDYIQAGRKTAVQAARIIRGENPEDIPFGRIDKFDFIINLDAAREAGFQIPPEVLAKADKVIGKADNASGTVEGE